MINRKHRFHGRNSLRFVYSRGEMVRGSLFSVKVALNQRRHSYRMAVVVSRKVHKSAVVRNRIRRRIYEVMRDQESHITDAYDIIFLVHSDQLALCEHDQLESQVVEQLAKAGVLSDKKPATN